MYKNIDKNALNIITFRMWCYISYLQFVVVMSAVTEELLTVLSLFSVSILFLFIFFLVYAALRISRIAVPKIKNGRIKFRRTLTVTAMGAFVGFLLPFALIGVFIIGDLTFDDVLLWLSISTSAAISGGLIAFGFITQVNAASQRLNQVQKKPVKEKRPLDESAFWSFMTWEWLALTLAGEAIIFAAVAQVFQDFVNGTGGRYSWPYYRLIMPIFWLLTVLFLSYTSLFHAKAFQKKHVEQDVSRTYLVTIFFTSCMGLTVLGLSIFGLIALFQPD